MSVTGDPSHAKIYTLNEGSRREVRPIWGGFAAARPGQDRTGDPLADAVAGRGGASHMTSPSSLTPRRVGALSAANAHAIDPIPHRPGEVVLRLSTRSLATFGSLGGAIIFLLVALIASQSSVPARAHAAATFAEPATPAIPLDMRMAQPIEAAETPEPLAAAAEGISVDEYGRQVAMATLTGSLHEITTSQVTFFRDPDRPGNAFQQFADVFGRAIATGRNPLNAELPEPR